MAPVGAVDRDRGEGAARARPRRHRPERRPALGPARRRGPESAARAGARSSPSLHEPDGAVAVAGFYDDVAPLSAADRAALDARAVRRGGLPRRGRRAGPARRAGLHDARAAVDAADARGERRRGRRPVHGDSAARPRARHLPARARARSLPRSSRPSPRHVQAHRPAGVEVAVEGLRREPCRPTRSRPTTPPSAPATSALRTVYPDRETLLVRIGGTLPAAALFEQILGLKTLLFSFSTADEQLHAPDEFFRLQPPRRGPAGLGRALAGCWQLRQRPRRGHAAFGIVVTSPTAVRSRRSPCCKGARRASSPQSVRIPRHGGRLAVAGSAAALAARTSHRSSRVRPRPSAAATSRSRASRTRSPFDKTNVFQNESIWIAEQINEPLYLAGNDGKTLRPWLATSYTKSKDGKTYTFKLRPGVKFSNGKADDVRRRQVLDRRRARPEEGLGLPRRCDQEHRRARSEHRRLPPQVPVGAVPRRHRAVRERDHPEELRRPVADGVLQAPDRHRPVHVGQARRRPVGDVQAQPVLLAEGQAVPRRASRGRT